MTLPEIMLHTIMAWQQQQHKMSAQILGALQSQVTQEFEGVESAENSATVESVPNEVRTTLTTASRMSEPFQDEKTLQNIEKLQSPRVSYREAEKIARHLYDLKNSYVMLERSRSLLQL